MKVKMLITVEDMFEDVVTDANGNPSIASTTDKFFEGQVVEMPERRAKKLISLGYAEAV